MGNDGHVGGTTGEEQSDCEKSETKPAGVRDVGGRRTERGMARPLRDRVHVSPTTPRFFHSKSCVFPLPAIESLCGTIRWSTGSFARRASQWELNQRFTMPSPLFQKSIVELEHFFEDWHSSPEQLRVLKAEFDHRKRPNGNKPAEGTGFIDSLKQRGCQAKRKHSGRGWQVIGLVLDDHSSRKTERTGLL